MPFEKGKSGNPQGSKPGVHHSGRPADWLIKKCQSLVDKKKLVEFLANVASGHEFPQLATSEGEVLPLPPSIKDRIRATEILLNRGFGKEPDLSNTLPEQSVVNAAKALEILKEMERRFESANA